MSVRSSPRLRAIARSDHSGKRAVFAPRLTRVTTSKREFQSQSIRNKTEDDLKQTSSDHVMQCSPLACPGKATTVCKSQSKVNKDEVKADDWCEHLSRLSETQGRSLRTCRLRMKRSNASTIKDLDVTAQKATLKQKKLPIEIVKELHNPTVQNFFKVTPVHSKKTVEKHLTIEPTDSLRKEDLSTQNDVSVSNISTTCTTGLVNVKRKRGRPRKNATDTHKRVKLSSTGVPATASKAKVSPIGEECHSLGSEKWTSSSSHSKVSVSGRLNPVISSDVIDLTCVDETVHEEVDGDIPSEAQHSTIQEKDIHSLSDKIKDYYKDIFCNEDPLIEPSDASNSDHLETSDCVLHNSSELTIAQLFDVSSAENGKKVFNTAASSMDSDTIAIPSLKRTKSFVKEVPASLDQNCLLEVQVLDNIPKSSNPSSPVEEEFPQPSTPQQKTMRRLARQKQLEEMRAREAALLREERLLRRKGILPRSSRTAEETSSAKRISWKDETDLVELFIYSPVEDDDDDTISVHSNENDGGMDSDILSLSNTVNN